MARADTKDVTLILALAAILLGGAVAVTGRLWGRAHWWRVFADVTSSGGYGGARATVYGKEGAPDAYGSDALDRTIVYETRGARLVVPVVVERNGSSERRWARVRARLEPGRTLRVVYLTATPHRAQWRLAYDPVDAISELFVREMGAAPAALVAGGLGLMAIGAGLLRAASVQ
jgi:hypothetical protein